MKKKIIICLIMILIISIVFFITRKIVKIGSGEKISSLPINYIEENKENENSIEQNQEKIIKIIEEQGIQADEKIYEIGKEYDGREILIVKSNLKYKLALAGMIKNEKPEYTELDNILESAPKHTGIWISEKSKGTFLKILEKITNATYTIDEQGFLIQKEVWVMNKYDNKIAKMLSDDKLHVFDIDSITYVIDEVTGEIQEYPFEEIDPNNKYEYFKSDNKEIFIISGNLKGKINQEEILKEILE